MTQLVTRREAWTGLEDSLQRWVDAGISTEEQARRTAWRDGAGRKAVQGRTFYPSGSPLTGRSVARQIPSPPTTRGGEMNAQLFLDASACRC